MKRKTQKAPQIAWNRPKSTPNHFGATPETPPELSRAVLKRRSRPRPSGSSQAAILGPPAALSSERAQNRWNSAQDAPDSLQCPPQSPSILSAGTRMPLLFKKPPNFIAGTLKSLLRLLQSSPRPKNLKNIPKSCPENFQIPILGAPRSPLHP